MVVQRQKHLPQRPTARETAKFSEREKGEHLLDTALADSFPASDPVAMAQPAGGGGGIAKTDESTKSSHRCSDPGCCRAGVFGRDVAIPDSRMCREATEMIRDTESELLFRHSTRVYLFGALAGHRRQVKFDPELLYIGAMFHDIGLTEMFAFSRNRFEVDGANAAREFLRQHGVAEDAVQTVWDAIALHTTPGIPEHKQPEVALVTVGVEMDVLGIGYDSFADVERDAVVAAYPRGEEFKQGIIQAFYAGMKHRPETTFGTVNDDVIAHFEPDFARTDFCGVILGSAWRS